jgi:hypothetical protein
MQKLDVPSINASVILFSFSKISKLGHELICGNVSCLISGIKMRHVEEVSSI